MWPCYWKMLDASLESDCRGSLCWLFNSFLAFGLGQL